MDTKEKREITPHKGGRTVRINCRVTPETKELFLDLAEENKMQQADFLEFLIKKEGEKS
jgi:hypothetical protein